MRRCRTLAATALLTLHVGGCGAGDSRACLAQGAAEVCADNSDGSIEFTGSGLQPDSAVLIDHPDIGMSVYEVGADGTFEPDGRGVLSMIADMPFTFGITATDVDGRLIEGEIDISS